MVRAALGQREEDDGSTCPIDPDRAGTARRQAARITVLAVVLGIVGAFAAWAIGQLLGRAG